MTDRTLSVKLLRNKYRTRVSPKLAALEKIIEAMNPDPIEPIEFQKLKLLVHKIHGSAGSFEFDQASRIAGEWELWLRTLSSKPAIEAEDIARMRNLLADLRNSLA